MTRVKICGITNEKDALFCSEHGADALGFVFYEKSPRYIALKKAKEIIKKLPPFISIVGLFVNENPDTVRELSKLLRLDVLQFHGDEDAAYVNAFHKKKIKAFRVKDSIDTDMMEEYDVDAYLLDSHAGGLYGGSGSAFSWDLIAGRDFKKPVILAGGLDPENIVDAVKKTRPYAVDVSSGVEIDKGIKDLDKVKKFIVRAKHGRHEK